MTITDHILVSNLSVGHFITIKLYGATPPPTFKTLTVDNAKTGTIQLSLNKLLTWFVIVCETDILEDCLHSPCCIQCDRLLSSRHLTWFCFLCVPWKGSGGDSRLLVSVFAQYPCVMHVRYVWYRGWDGYGNMEFLYCSGACPWRCCHWWKHRRSNSLNTSSHLDH